MYELIQLTEHDYYINCPAKIGIVVNENSEAVLIDSGNDKDAGKKVLKIMEANGWKLTTVFNTHSHADHIGGNRFLQEKTGCRIFASELEQAYTVNPILEPIGLYGGQPLKDLKHKFTMAQDSVAEKLTEDSLTDGISLLKLPGHSFDMVGFLTKDRTAYIADSVSSRDTLAKYGISYLWDADASLNTLDVLQRISADRFVPSHAPVTEDISELAELNRNAIQGVREKLLEICSEPISFEEILKEVFDCYQMEMNITQYALIGSTVRSYLTGLCAQGRIGYSFSDNRMYWKRLE